MAERCKAWNAFALSNTEIFGLNFTLDMDVCSHFFRFCIVLPHPSEEFYQLSVRFMVFRLILNGNRSEGLILQGRRKVNSFPQIKGPH
jgi:hypothetical protein